MGKVRPGVCVWLEDGVARLIVGAPPRDQDERPDRWAVQGDITEDVGAGLWLKAGTVQQFLQREDGLRKLADWTFKSPELFIPWQAVLTIQAFEGETSPI